MVWGYPPTIHQPYPTITPTFQRHQGPSLSQAWLVQLGDPEIVRHPTVVLFAVRQGSGGRWREADHVGILLRLW